MRFTPKQAKDVMDLVSEYSVGVESPERAVREALSAILVGDAHPIAYEVAQAGGVELVTPHIWAREEPRMTPETAREIIKQALADNIWEAEAPEDDEQVVSDAQQLVKMAEDAWEANVRGPEVEAILKIAAADPEADEEPAKPKPKPKPAAAKAKPGRPKPKVAAPESEPEAETLEEPWENYDKDVVKDIVEAIDVWSEQKEHEGILQVYLYELANKNRKNVIAACVAALPEDMIPSDQGAEEPEEAQEEAETEAEIPEEWSTEPFETYDTLKVPDIKEALNDFFENEEYSDEDKLNTLGHVAYYESSNKNRSGLIEYLEGITAAYEEARGVDAEGATEEEGEAEGAAAPKADAPAARRPARGKAGGKKAADQAGEGGSSDGTTYTVSSDGGDEIVVHSMNTAGAIVVALLNGGAAQVSVAVNG